MIVASDTDWRLLSTRRPAGKALIVSFFLLPILDNLSGAGVSFSGFSVSLLFRMLVLVFFFFVASKFEYAAAPKLLGIIAVLILPILLRFVVDGESGHLSGDIIRLLKTLYGIFGMYTVYALLKHGELDSEQLISATAVSALVYCSIIVAASLLNFGISAYGGGRGTTGFVLAGNDVSHSIAISVPFVYWYATKRIRHIAFKVAILGLTGAAMFLLFTKSGILGMAVLVWLIFRGSPRAGRILLMMIGGAVIVYIIGSIAAESGIVYELVSAYRILHEEFGFLGIFFRGRQDIFNLLPKMYGDLSPGELLFGTGITEFSMRYAELSSYWAGKMKNAEMDLFDLFFSHGFIGTAAVLWIYLRYSKYAFLKTKEGIDLRFSLMIFWIHSVFAGHAMSTPIVGTYIAAILGLGYFSRESRGAQT